jgi:hypothetical protein
MIDLFITSYLREKYTGETLRYLEERTKTPYRSFLIDNGGNEEHKDKVDCYIGLSKNIGIHAAWNLALSLAESEYFITSDNDIYVPDLDPDWLSQLIGFMDNRPDFGAISLHPHVFIGINGEDPLDPEDVKISPMAGAVMRIMRTEAVRKAGGWEHKIEAGRNHEERTICSRLQDAGYVVGRTTRIRAFHPFGDNWGYPPEFTPQMQKHNPELNSYVNQFNNMDAYDPKTFLPK